MAKYFNFIYLRRHNIFQKLLIIKQFVIYFHIYNFRYEEKARKNKILLYSVSCFVAIVNR